MLPRGGEFLIWFLVGEEGTCLDASIGANDQGEFFVMGLELS